MKTSSAKAKGRRLQQKVVAMLSEFFLWPSSDAKSIPMGAQGADIWLAGKARAQFPFAIECKNVEKINLWQAWEQAKSHAAAEPGLSPMVILSRNHEEVLVVLRLNDLLNSLYVE